MKKTSLFLLIIGSVLLSGCVSSQRMARMSGGVFDEYSAPPSYRLRSKKFQKKTPHADSINRANTQKVSGLNDTLINIWPFFFRNNAYWSVLWPFIDCDDYGFAIRPFYVQDGDEYSVLFPLAAWNPENKDGWVANFVWNDNGFGFVPFSWQNTKKDHGWFYYTPFFIHKYDKRPLEFGYRKNRFYRQDHYTEFMLAYWSKDRRVMTGDYSWLLNYWNFNDGDHLAKLAYYFAKLGKPVPKEMSELEKIQKDVFRTLPVNTGYSYGFFPLFHYSKQPDGNVNCQILLVNGYEKKKNHFSWSILAALASYKDNELDPKYTWKSAEKEFFSFPLFTKLTTKKEYENVGAVKTLREINNLLTSQSYNQSLPRIKELIKELDPKLELPATVVNNATLRLFLDDWKKGKTFPVKESYSGGNPLIFLYDINGKNRTYIYSALLTRYKTTGSSAEFGCIPLLTFARKTPDNSYLRIVPPLVYMDSFSRDRDVHTKRIHSSDTKMAKKWDVVEEMDMYAALGLFYRGKIAFHVAKQGYNGGDLEYLRKNLLNIQYEKNGIKNSWEEHAAEKKRIAAWKTKNKIEYYEKCIKEEKSKIAAEKIRKREQEVAAKWSLMKSTAAKIKFNISEADVANSKASVDAVNRLLKDYTELRWKEDIGNGFFFRKEKFYNGDYNWRLLGFIAGGEKVGSKENTNVLHLLYRYRQDGKRSETLFFPFVSIVKDGEDSKFSFLWRVFQLKKEKGKTGGYFLFIPF